MSFHTSLKLLDKDLYNIVFQFSLDEKLGICVLEKASYRFGEKNIGIPIGHSTRTLINGCFMPILCVWDIVSQHWEKLLTPNLGNYLERDDKCKAWDKIGKCSYDKTIISSLETVLYSTALLSAHWTLIHRNISVSCTLNETGKHRKSNN